MSARALYSCASTLFTLFLFWLMHGAAHAATPGDGHPTPAPLPASVEPLADGLSRGAYLERVPLDLPPAPAGAVPRISLLHDPAVREGWLGFGWRLAGPSRIERRSATGGVPRFGVGQPASGDLYRLDGVDLVEDTATGCWTPEVWDGSCLRFDAESNTWTWTRDGWSRTFGGGDATWGVVDDPVPGSTAAWHLSEERPPVGEPIVWTWEIDRDLSGSALLDGARGLPRLTHVAYGQVGELVFEYAERPDPRLDASSGVAGVYYRRLVAVEAQHAKQLYSRYSLGYLDQADYPSVAAAVDCDGQPISADPSPAQVLLQRVARETQAGARFGAAHQVLRCATVADEADAWSSGQDLSAALSLSVLEGLEGDEQVSLRAHPVNLNGDGLPDLFLIASVCDVYPAMHSNDPDAAPLELPSQTLCDSEGLAMVNRAPYVTGPGQAHAFGLVEEPAWTQTLNTWLSGTPGAPVYALGDLDRDGRVELLYDDAGVVRVLSPDPRDRTIRRDALGLTTAELALGQLIDVDGDGLPDLVTPAWEDRLGHMTESSWRRNTGDAAGWFDLPEPLAWPLEDPNALSPEGWDAVGACANSAFPYDAPPAAAVNPEVWRARSSRLADLNGDGLVDVAVALHACWSADSEPDDSSAFSRVFYGLGDGHFEDSGLSAGRPFDANLYDHDTWPRSETTLPGQWAGAELFSAVDLDRSGHPSLLQWGGVGADGRSEIWGAADRGLLAGFSLDADPNLAAPAELNFGLSSFSATYPWLQHSALADFDGDGFPDRLVFELIPSDPSETTPDLSDATWSVTFQASTRAHTQGRLIALAGPWGGVTELGWRFTAQYPDDNPELNVNLEVLEWSRGEGGLVALRYRHGFHDGERFRGFGLVEQRDPLGVSLQGYDLSPLSPGAPVLSARLYGDGSVAAASLSFYADTRGGAWVVDGVAPYFNPLARRCEVELLAGNSETVASLFERCVSVEGGEPISASALGARFGYLPWADDDLAPVAEVAYGREAAEGVSLSELSGAVAAWDFSDLPVSIDLTEERSVETAHGWADPDLPEAPPSPTSGPVAERLRATSWVYNSDHRLESVLHHREVGLADDDLEQHYSWHAFDPAAWGQPLREIETTGPGGHPTWARLERLDLDPGAYDLPRTLRQWGDSTDFIELRHDYSATGPRTGQPQQTTWPDGSVETFTFDVNCGALTEHVDRGGRVRAQSLDALCRVEAESFEGAAVTRSFDALHRVLTQTTDPDEDDPTDADLVTVEHLYAGAYGVDPSEPLRQLSRSSAGRVEALELDGFGRPTFATACVEGGAAADDLPFAWGPWACDAAEPVLVSAMLWGNDGQLAASAARHEDGVEDPEITSFAWDLLGREAASSSPSPAGGQALTERVYGPGFTRSTDALGVESIALYDSLSAELSRDGVPRSFELRDALGRVEERVDASGVMSLYTYDGLHRLETEERLGDPSVTAGDDACEAAAGELPLERPCSYRWTHSYDLTRREHSVTDPQGTTTTETYDPLGRLVSREVDGVQVLSVSILDRAPSRPVEITTTDLQGASVTRQLDGLGRAVRVSDLDGDATFTYGPAGLERVETPAGRAVYQERDAFGRLIAACWPSGASAGGCVSPFEELDYTGAGQLAWARDADGVEAHYAYAPGGLVEEIVEGGALVYEAEYDALGRLTTAWEGAVERRYAYDSLHRVERVEEGPEGAPLRWQQLTWGDGDRLLARELGPVDGGSLTSRFSWHDLGWLREVEHPDGSVKRLHYDALGRERFVEHEAGALSRVRYDTLGRVVEEKRPGQGLRSYAYAPNVSWDGLSHLAERAMTDGEGAQSLAWFDGAGRLVGAEDATGVVQRHHYAAGERWASEVRDPSGAPLALKVWLSDAETGWTTHELGWFEPPYGNGVTPAQGDFGAPGASDYTVEYGYTAAGRLASVGAGEELTEFTYDAGRLSEERWDGGVRSTSYSYDAYGVLDATLEVGSDGSQRATSYGYDALGRRTQTLIDDGSSTLEVVAQGLDARGLPAQVTRSWDGVEESAESWTWSDRGQPTRRAQDVGGASLVTDWSWTADGQLASITLPSGRSLSLRYGLSGGDHLPERLLDADGGALVELLSRDGELRPTALDVGSHRLELRYDAVGRPVERAWVGEASWSGHWDDRGRLESESYADAGRSWTADYVYAEPGWLVQEVITDSALEDTIVRDYVYDAGGRRETVSDADGVLGSVSWSGSLPERVDGAAAPVDPWDAREEDPSGAQLYRDPSGALSDREAADGALTSWTRSPSGLPVLSADCSTTDPASIGGRPGPWTARARWRC